MGIVFQDSDDQLFQSSIGDDVAFGPLNLGMPPDEARARAAEALRQVGMAGSEGRVPYHLSGGEKRRVALAGVLAMRPEVLLLDGGRIVADGLAAEVLADAARMEAHGLEVPWSLR